MYYTSKSVRWHHRYCGNNDDVIMHSCTSLWPSCKAWKQGTCVVHSAYPSNQIRLASYWMGLLNLVQPVDMDHMSSSSTQQGSFPSPCGAEASSSLLSEEDLLARLPQGRKVCVYVCVRWREGEGEGERERRREGGRESGEGEREWRGGEREREKGRERRRGGEFGKGTQDGFFTAHRLLRNSQAT